MSSFLTIECCEENASVAILRRVGMTFAGELEGGKDGIIWRWEIAKAD
jgi:hypothetical protein